MAEFSIDGYVYLQIPGEPRLPIRGALVIHVPNQPPGQLPLELLEGQGGAGSNRTNAKGYYLIRFRSQQYAHQVSCTVDAGATVTVNGQIQPVVVVGDATQVQNPDAFTPGIQRYQRQLEDFEFQQPESGGEEQGAIAHDCGAVCHTKEGPCENRIKNRYHCHWHTEQDPVATV